MKIIKNRIIPLEEEEQKALVQWLNIKKIKHTAIPNSTYRCLQVLIVHFQLYHRMLEQIYSYCSI